MAYFPQTKSLPPKVVPGSFIGANPQYYVSGSSNAGCKCDMNDSKPNIPAILVLLFIMLVSISGTLALRFKISRK